MPTQLIESLLNNLIEIMIPPCQAREGGVGCRRGCGEGGGREGAGAVGLGRGGGGGGVKIEPLNAGVGVGLIYLLALDSLRLVSTPCCVRR